MIINRLETWTKQNLEEQPCLNQQIHQKSPCKALIRQAEEEIRRAKDIYNKRNKHKRVKITLLMNSSKRGHNKTKKKNSN